ncbi:hypothetical protein PPTG_17489 [Phytophthora nicotianae INRA-310]|uniref:Uncharacterized protein n=1 Tax=Phytophthora nicotianae (strain INRA-310) TaxID=761204 RepID=W2PJK2_PHYN3|nr:hypothetical protein PPTG_17489 [Phytophthora nicotianae INRA-310]ETN01047.1 hypothetical protein PPTG_17489 [Phytophthora nicotianae INRA-310]
MTNHGGGGEEVADNMEEKHFLFKQTKYPRLSGDDFDAYREVCMPSSRESYWSKESEWKEIKAILCVEYLRVNKGLTLPQKWERCRSRFDELISRGDDPSLKALSVYLGKDTLVEVDTK